MIRKIATMLSRADAELIVDRILSCGWAWELRENIRGVPTNAGWEIHSDCDAKISDFLSFWISGWMNAIEYCKEQTKGQV